MTVLAYNKWNVLAPSFGRGHFGAGRFDTVAFAFNYVNAKERKFRVKYYLKGRNAARKGTRS